MKKLYILFCLFFYANAILGQNNYIYQRQDESDGYVWYKIFNGNLSGAANAQRQIIIPPSKSKIYYKPINNRPTLGYFSVVENQYDAIYNKQGECIISSNRGYKWIILRDEEESPYYEYSNPENSRGACDLWGREILPAQYKILVYTNEFKGKKGYYDENYQSTGIYLDSNNLAYRKKWDGSKEYLYELFAKDSSGKKYFKSNINGKHGLIDDNNNVILDNNNDVIELTKSRHILYKKDGYYGVKTLQGNTIISIYDKYTFIGEQSHNDRSYYSLQKNGRFGLADNAGKIIVPVEMDALESAGTGYLRFKPNGFWGLMNFTGKILIDTNRGYTSIGDFKSFNKRFAYTMNGYKGECDATGRQISKIKVDTPKQNTSVASSSSSNSSNSSSSSSGSSSNSNSGNNTTTVVVEHQRQPVPVQEWVQCTACWGSGICPNCAGSGTTYIGSNLHRCSRCGGRGKCSSCSGQGGRYYTVYK